MIAVALAAAGALGLDLGRAPNAAATDLVVTSVADSGPGTLRAAVEASRADHDADVITFDLPAGADTIELADSLPAFSGQMTIVGPGADRLTITIDERRIFWTRHDFTLSGVTLADAAADRGGAIYSTGADLVVDDVVFRDNRSVDEGGAVYVEGGTAIVRDSVFTGNHAGADGGAVFAGPLGLYTSIEVERSTVTGNSSEGAGAAVATTGDLRLDGVFVADNHSVTGDAQIAHANGLLSIHDSTLAGSGTGTDDDLLLTVTPVQQSLEVPVIGSTFSGGRVELERSVFARALLSTFVDARFDLAPGVNSIGDATLDVDLSVVAGEGWSDDHVTSVSASLVEDASGLTGAVDRGGNLFDVDARLGPLADNGGPVPTHLPGPSSPVIDAGPAARSDFPTRDQRGAPRVWNRLVDLGSVETSPWPALRTIATPITPARLVDTRPHGVTIDGRESGGGPVTRRSIEITDRGGIPADATAIIANVTAVGPGTDGWLAAVPCDVTVPTTASLNYHLGVTISSEIVAPLSADGTLCIDASAPTDVVIDVVAFLTTGSGIDVTAPVRLEDTRPASTVDVPGRSDTSRLTAGQTLRFTATGRGPVPDDAVAVVVNVTAVNPTAPGFLTAHPCLVTPPPTAAVNYAGGVTRGNELIVAVDERGRACITASDPVDVTVDVVGWVRADAAYTVLEPARLLDTRLDERLSAGQTIEVPVAGRGGVTLDATSATLNVTAVNPSAGGHLTVRDCDDTTSLVASLTFSPGITGGNEIIASIGRAGNVCITTSSATDVTVDVAGHGYDI